MSYLRSLGQTPEPPKANVAAVGGAMFVLAIPLIFFILMKRKLS